MSRHEGWKGNHDLKIRVSTSVALWGRSIHPTNQRQGNERRPTELELT